MTEIKKQALALLDEVMAEVKRGGLAFRFLPEASQVVVAEALICALEQKAALQAEFDQFRQEVSQMADAICVNFLLDRKVRKLLTPFILPKPVDPLVEAMNEMGFGCSEADAKRLRDALAKRNARIVWEAE